MNININKEEIYVYLLFDTIERDKSICDQWLLKI